MTSAIDTQRQVAIISQYGLEAMPTRMHSSPPPISVPNIELQLEGEPPIIRDERGQVAVVEDDVEQHQHKDLPKTVHKETTNDGKQESDAMSLSRSCNVDATGCIATASDQDRVDRVMEPASVSQARAELATLVSDRQRMEARQKRLQRRLDELDDQMKEVHEVRNILNYYVLYAYMVTTTMHTCMSL